MYLKVVWNEEHIRVFTVYELLTMEKRYCTTPTWMKAPYIFSCPHSAELKFSKVQWQLSKHPVFVVQLSVSKEFNILLGNVKLTVPRSSVLNPTDRRDLMSQFLSLMLIQYFIYLNKSFTKLTAMGY